MMKTTRLFSFLLFFGSLSVNLRAQTSANFKPQIFTQSPNSASLGKYGDYPVSMFSGVPNISVPLYEIQAGDIKIPISLDYHASGNRVYDVASWAGLGWSVSAGGEITRKIEGKPDEGTSGYLSGTLRSPASINTTNEDDLFYLNSIKAGETDGQPDIFSYSLPGRSGKFFFNGTKSGFPIQLVPFAPVKITRTSPQFLTGFNILDEHGNTFQYGTMETTDAFPNNASNPQTSAWMLDKMVSQSGKDVIDFSYTSNHVMSGFGAVETVSINDLSENADPSSPVYFNSEPSTSVSTSNQATREQLLNTITFKNGKVVFVRSVSDRQDLASKSLDNIQVYGFDPATQQYTLLKTIKFYQSYFTDGTSAHPPRLRLDSIGFFDGSNTKIQRYAFYYNNNTLLPDVNTKAQDFWGYYNGLDNQTSLIPKMSVDYQTFGGGLSSRTIGSNVSNGRDPNGDKMQACILQRIVYPTGGYTDFQFEPNQYYNQAGALTLAGGLRVSNIINYDGINPTPVMKSYRYADARPNFFIVDNNIVERLFSTSVPANYFKIFSSPTAQGEVYEGSQRQRSFYSSANADINSWDGVIVAYRAVTEYTSDGATNTGKTVYRYSDHSDAKASASITGKLFTNSFFFDRGQLLEKAVYARDPDNMFRIVEREKMTYTAFPLSMYNGVGLAVSKKYVNQTAIGPDELHTNPSDSFNDFNAFWFEPCDIFSDDNYLTGKTTTNYSPDTTKFTQSTEIYRYYNVIHQQPSRVYRTNSKGNTVVSSMKYAADYLPVNSTTTGNTILDNMISRNMQADLIEKWDSVKYRSPVSVAVTSAELHTYKAGALSAILPDKINRLNIPALVASYDTAKVISGQLHSDSRYDPVPEVSFDAYDAQNNVLLQYTSHGGNATSILWDYGNYLPVAEVKNAQRNQVAYTSFEADGKGNWSFSGTPVSGGIPGGKRAYTLSSGSITSSALDASKNYTVTYWSIGSAATVTGANPEPGTQVSSLNGWIFYQHQIPAGTSSVSVSGSVTIDELRLYPLDGEATTYTYTPLVGINSKIDARGQATYYEYDQFQRLVNIRDMNNNITKNFNYNYAPRLAGNPSIVGYYFNASVSRSIQKTGCAANTTGSYVVYTVPEQKYSSTISQADADLKAQNEIDAMGQSYANSHGNCLTTYYSAEAHDTFHKNNCGVGFPGSAYTYSVPERTYSSVISQDDADQKAKDDVNANGQAQANAHGSCPNGTDIANWGIVTTIDSNDPGAHAVTVTVTRPQGDINNTNDVTFHIATSTLGNLPGSFTMPAGTNTSTYHASFTSSMSGIITGTYIDSIN